MISPQEGVSRASSEITTEEQPGGLSDSFAPPGLLRQSREQADQVFVGLPDPFSLRSDAEQMLGDDQAGQPNIVEPWFPARMVIAGKAERGHDPVVDMYVKCGQKGVQIGFHTQRFRPSAFD